MTITAGVHTKAETNNAPTLPTSAIATQPTGSLIFAMMAGQAGPSFTDSKGNTWTLAGTANFSGGNGIANCYYAQNALGGSGHIFTGAQTGGAGPWFFLSEFLGAALSGGPHAAATPTEISGSTAAVAGLPVTTTVAGCLIVTVLVGGAPTLAVPTSANGTVTDGFSTNGDNVAGGMSWFIAGAPGVYSDTLTFAGMTAYDFDAFTFAFAPGSGGGVISAARNLSAGGPGVMPRNPNQFRASPRATTTVPAFFWTVQMGAVVGLSSALTTGARTGGLGFVPQPGPGVGPFTNSQFQSAPRAVTSAPQTFLMASQAAAQVSFTPSLSQLQLFAASCGAVASMTATMTTQAASGGIGYLTQPGPGVGPFSNSQFQSAPRSTNQPFQQLIGALSAGAKVSVTASLTSGLTMASVAGAQVGATPALTTGLNLATSMGALVSASPALTSGISLAVNAGGFVSATAALSSGINLAVSSQAIVSASGAIGAGAQFAVSASGQVQSTAALATGLSLAATPGAQVSFSPSATTGISLAAQSGAIASATQGMSASILLASQLAGQVGSVSALSSGIRLASGSQAQVSLTGSFTVGSAVLASFAAAQVALSVALNAQITMAVQHGAKASMITAMTTGIQMQARGAAIASFQSTAQGQIPNLSGSPNLVESDYEQRIVTRN